MTRANVQTQLEAAQLIRRRVSSSATRRYATSLPVFQVTEQIPQYMADMLARLEESEGRKRR